MSIDFLNSKFERQLTQSGEVRSLISGSIDDEILFECFVVTKGEFSLDMLTE